MALLVIATSNPGKLREFRALLAELPFEVVAQGELGIVTPPETGTTFLDNALLKARHAAQWSGAAALADDSGLEVDALGGAPGIYSARYAGAGADDAANNAKLLAELARVNSGSVPPRPRARYRCALAFVTGTTGPERLITAEAAWEGEIVATPRGVGGFGYDPHFWLPELGETVAELDPAVKQRLGHRGRALRDLQRRLAAHVATSAMTSVRGP